MNPFLKYIIICISLLIGGVLSAQTIVRVDSVRGIAESFSSYNKWDVCLKAFEDGRKNALLSAGIQNIVFAEDVFATDKGPDYVEDYYSGRADFGKVGSIVSYRLLEENFAIDSSDGYCSCEVLLEAYTNIHETKRAENNSATLQVHRLKKFYKDFENFNFELIAPDSGYFMVFYFSPKSSSQIFPNKYEEQVFIPGKRSIHFPQSDNIQYRFQLDHAKMEENILLFLWTKDPYFFPSKLLTGAEPTLNMQRVLDWVMNIPIDKRELQIKTVGITR